MRSYCVCECDTENLTLNTVCHKWVWHNDNGEYSVVILIIIITPTLTLASKHHATVRFQPNTGTCPTQWRIQGGHRLPSPFELAIGLLAQFFSEKPLFFCVGLKGL